MYKINQIKLHGDLKKLHNILKSSQSVSLNTHLNELLSDVEVYVDMLCDFPTASCINYFFPVTTVTHGEPALLSDIEGFEAKDSTGYAIRSLCETAKAISKDNDIKEEDRKTIINRIVPMAGLISHISLTIGGEVLKEIFSSPEELFASSHNDMGLPLVDPDYDEEKILYRVFNKFIKSTIPNKMLQLFAGNAQTQDVAEYYEKNYFKYHSSKDKPKRNKFTIASIKEIGGRMDFLGSDKDKLSAQMAELSSSSADVKAGRSACLKLTLVATTTIREMFEFMSHMSNGTVKILAIKPLAEWVNNPIAIDPEEITKYMVRISEPVSDVKKYITYLIGSHGKSTSIPEAIKACFGGHMIDYIMEVTIRPGFPNTVDNLLPITQKNYNEVINSVMKLHKNHT